MLGLYIHIPFCQQKCAYCDFCSFPAEATTRERYVNALVREIALAAEAAPDKAADTVFIGGGTPTLLTSEQLRRIFDAVAQHYTLVPSAEISIESNPATLTDEHLALFREMGITRISIGLQATQDHLLKRLGRIHSWAQFLETYRRVRAAGSWDINVDLIYHLPGQTRKDWTETLDHVIALNPAHISCYSLQLEEGTPLEAAVAAGRYRLSQDRTDRWMHHTAIDLLAAHGYEQYEISNFAKPGHACRHNLKYWQRLPYQGLGLAAHGFDGRRRLANPESLVSYLSALEQGQLAVEIVETLDVKDALFETVMLGLRMTAGIVWEDAMTTCPPDQRPHWEHVCQRLKTQELLRENAGRLQLTRQGMDLSNSVFAAFMEI